MPVWFGTAPRWLLSVSEPANQHVRDAAVRRAVRGAVGSAARVVAVKGVALKGAAVKIAAIPR